VILSVTAYHNGVALSVFAKTHSYDLLYIHDALLVLHSITHCIAKVVLYYIMLTLCTHIHVYIYVYSSYMLYLV
jgi:hypothetical protein